VFHVECVDAWLRDSRRRCPMCRKHPRVPLKVDVGTQTPVWDSPDWDEAGPAFASAHGPGYDQEAACEAPWPSTRSMDTE